MNEQLQARTILRAFDIETTATDPYLSARAVADTLDTHWDHAVSVEAVETQLSRLADDGLVAIRDRAHDTNYRALVRPPLAGERKRISERRQETARDEFVPLSEI